jgi:hypothetical protein
VLGVCSFEKVVCWTGDVPKSPSTQPHVSGLRFVWRLLSSFIEGPSVGFGVMPSRARVSSVGAGPPNATPFTTGSSTAPTRLKTFECFILRTSLANDAARGGRETDKERGKRLIELM